MTPKSCGLFGPDHARKQEGAASPALAFLLWLAMMPTLAHAADRPQHKLRRDTFVGPVLEKPEDVLTSPDTFVGPLAPEKPEDILARPDTFVGPPSPSQCILDLVTSGLADADPLSSIAEPNGCGAPDPVRLNAVLVENRRVPMTPPATLRCSMATAIVRWTREDVAPLVAGLGAPLSGIEDAGSYECRGRNRVADAKLSEHGRANALDIRSLLLADGRHLVLTDPAADRPFRDSLKASACKTFPTVLGPGSDGYHEEHIHVDLIERRNNYRICQWDVRDPTVPLPPPRPPEAPERAEEHEPR